MTGFHEVQQTLDRILATGRPNHGPFWRGVSRDQFVNLKVWGLPLVVPGDPGRSNLVRALRGLSPFGADQNPRPPGAVFQRMPAGGLPAAAEVDIVLIEQWIGAGCPVLAPSVSAGLFEAMLAGAGVQVTDATHTHFWRAMEDFFLPLYASEETREHVGVMHSNAYVAWMETYRDGKSGEWPTYLASASVQESFRYIRKHQRRLLEAYYDNVDDAIMDSLWKFGANALPTDPDPRYLPRHTMNSVQDWFWWVPYHFAALSANDAEEVDLILARGWQIGLVADGLIRDMSDRGAGSAVMPIPDFQPVPDLRARAQATFANATPQQLMDQMLTRARAWGFIRFS
jgi:hypothetical protein